jgi:hypothetical protein
MATPNDGLAQYPEHLSVPGLSHSFQEHNIKTLFDLNADEIVRRLPLRKIELVVPEQPVNRCRKDLLEAAKKECGERWPFLTSKENWQAVLIHRDVHHKKPREIGGLNDIDNQILIDREVHPKIHHIINKILTRGGEVIRRRYPQLRGEKKTLLDWIKNGRDLEPLKDALSIVPGLSFDDRGKLFIAIPYPEGRVLIPYFLSNHAAAGRPVFECSNDPRFLRLD